MVEVARTDGPRYFLITSIGRTATYWLAWSLNRHPDILCSHGGNFPPSLVTYDKDGRAESELNRIGDPIRSIYDIPHACASGSDVSGTGARSQSAFHEKTIGEFLDAHRAFGEYAAIGNVHGYSLGNFLNRFRAGEVNRNIAVVNLIRHPVDQILSFYRRHKFDAERSDSYKSSRFKIVERYVEIAAAVQQVFGIDLQDHDTLIFLSSVFDVAGMQNDILVENVLHLRYETLTVSRPAFEALLKLLIGDADIALSESYLETVYAQGPMNYSSARKQAAEDAFDALADWQKFAISVSIDQEAARRYLAHGYDLAFLLDYSAKTKPT